MPPEQPEKPTPEAPEQAPEKAKPEPKPTPAPDPWWVQQGSRPPQEYR